MHSAFKTKHPDDQKQLVKEMVLRMAQAYGVARKTLPEHLGCSRALVNNWSYYGRIPYEHLAACADKTGVSMDWLLYGKVPMRTLSEDDIGLLTDKHQKVLQDGLAYELISEQHPGALTRLIHRFRKDLSQLAVPKSSKIAIADKHTGS